jgi:transposase InsO family protein
VLRVGDWVHVEGEDHQVVGLAGTQVRLRSRGGSSSVVMLSFLMASPGFRVVDGPAPPTVEPFGLLDTLPPELVARAREWERHLVEVVTGLPADAGPGATPRPGYDPQESTLAQREQVKAVELTDAGRPVSARTVRRMRMRYAEQGLWGLVDQRATRAANPAGRADPRLVAAIQTELDAQTHASTGTRGRLIRRVTKSLEAEYGPGAVALPGRSAFYELVAALSVGRHSFGAATTRRSLANRPDAPFTPTFAVRPGELVQIDSTPLDVMVVLDSGVIGRPELTAVVDVATRTIPAAVLRPAGTKAVDASLLLARMLVPEPMRPGWSAALGMSASRLPHARLIDVDTRLELAAAKPVIVPETIVIDHGKVFVSETFTRACNSLGISVQPSRPHTPTDKAIVERTFASINTLFCQYVAGYTGSNVTRRGSHVEADAVWSLSDLQDLLDEWIVAGWQSRPHEGLRDPHAPGRPVSPNDAYAAMVATAGYLPLTLSGEDYLELLPVAWRAINDYGIRIGHRTYDSPLLGPWRRQHSGVASKRGLWEVHYDSYDLSQVFVRTPDGWVTVPWTHLPMVAAPFADFTWRHARRLAAQAGRDDNNETEVARVLDELLSRAQAGPPVDKASARVAARTRVGAATHRRPSAEEPAVEHDEEEDKRGEQQRPPVVPMGIFDARAEAERWPY